MLDATYAPVNIRYPQDVSLLNKQGKSWKQSCIVFIKRMVCPFQEDIERKQEKIISHLQKVKSIVTKKSERHYADNLDM